MPVSLYSAFVPSTLRTLEAGKGWIAKAIAHAGEAGISEHDLVNAALFEDMWPLKYQIKSMATHSRGALEAAKAGIFTPDFGEPPVTFAALEEMLSGAITYLENVSEADVNSLQDNPMRFEVGPKKLDFENVAGYLFSFSQPNFYFHAVTAYGILRHKGIPVGKLDYLGKLPVTMG